MKFPILFILLFCFKTYSQTKIDVDLCVTKNRNNFFLLSEESFKVSKTNEITFKLENIKKHLVYNLPTNDYKRFFKDYKEGVIPDSIFKITVASRKIDPFDFQRLDNDDIIEVLVGIDMNNDLIIIPNTNNSKTFDDDSIYLFKLGSSAEKEINLNNINFKNINYQLGLDSSVMNLFANLKLIVFKDDLIKSKLYLYNNTFFTGKFYINDSAYTIKIDLNAMGLDFKYKYKVEYFIEQETGNFNKLLKKNSQPYRQGDTIKIGYYSIFLDSIEKFGEKAFLTYSLNKKYFSENMFFSNLLLSNISNNKFSTPLDKKEYKVIDFWASWCIPCLKQHSILENNYKLINQKKIKIIGINLDKSDLVKSKEYLKNRNLPWRNYSLVNWDDERNLRIRTYPTYFLLSPSNNILLTTFSADSVINFINKL